MSRFSAIANFGLISKYYNLVSLNFSHRGCYNLCPLNSRVTYERMLIIADKQYLAQLNHLAFSYFQVVNFYSLLGSDLILLAPCLNNSVNFLTSLLPDVILSPAHPIFLSAAKNPKDSSSLFALL